MNSKSSMMDEKLYLVEGIILQTSTVVKTVALLGIWLFAVTAGFTQNPPQPQPAGDQGSGLDKRIEGPVRFTNQDLTMLVGLLQSESGMDIVLDQGVNKKVTFSLDSPTIRQVLETVLPANGLDYYVADTGTVRIGNKDVIDQLKQKAVETITKTFTPSYIDVLQLQESLQSYLSSSGTMIMDPDSRKIIVSDIPEAIEAMQRLVDQLDVKQETRVFDLKYATAEEVADQLRGVLNTQEGELIIDYRNNRLIITDTPDRLDLAEQIINQIDTDLVTEVIPLAFALPEDILPIVEMLLTENGFIDFDPRTNYIIVQDIPSVVERIVELIKKLDIPTQQVWIEADIVQINNNKSLTMGVEMAFGDDIGANNDPNAPDNINSATQGFFSFNPFLSTSGDGLTLMNVIKGDYRFKIDALVEDNLAEVIASPRLLVQDGQLGSFTLGSEEPYASRQQGGFYGGGTFGGDYFTQRSRNVGTSMVMEVYASEAGYVEMFISVEDTRARRVPLANLGEGLAVDGSFIETAVTVKSGRTIVLGGIINRSLRRGSTGVPILSSIPLLGNLFKSKNNSEQKQKMLVFITPRIVNINDPFDFAQVDNFQRVRDLQSRGATGFVDTSLDDKMLDWSNEEQFEQQAIQEALKARERSNGRNGTRTNRRPSLQDQLDSGVIQYQKED